MPASRAVAFVTVGAGARPTARTVSLKRLEDRALVFTSALWTRKAREIAENPHVALLFHWPSLGRQVHVAGDAVLAERALAEELFAERDPVTPAADDRLAPGRADRRPRAAARAPRAPARGDGGAARRARPTGARFASAPHAVEFWSQSDDRMHDRLLYSARARAGR